MLADTDVGSVVTAAQSGAEWGYHLLLLEVLLIPILYLVQELTARLGIYTGKGHGELIRETFGPVWAWISVSGLGISVLGALVTEFSGVAAIGSLLGVSRFFSVFLAALFLLAVVWTGSYRRVERIAIFLGLFELAFFVIAWGAHPSWPAVLRGAFQLPISNPSYLYLVAANLGAVIMPWMIFYQQSAVVDKGLRPEHYPEERLDTLLGAILTQLIMIAVLVATAATLGRHHPGVSLNSVEQIVRVLIPFFGKTLGLWIFALGILGAALVAAIVVSLAVAWGFGEVSGYRHSLEYRPAQAPWFYGTFALAILAGALTVTLVPNLVQLTLAVEVMNACLLPLVLGFLVALAHRTLPAKLRLRGASLWVAISLTILLSALGVYGTLGSL